MKKFNYKKPSLDNLKDGGVLPIVHGENFLRPVTDVPKGDWTKHDIFTVGHSESGHNHVLDGKVEVLESKEKTIVHILKNTNLFHQKDHEVHETITVAPGFYEVTHKTEYDPFAKVVRRVFD